MNLDHASTLSFMLILVVIAANRFGLSSGFTSRYAVGYWTLQILNVSSAAAIAIFGIPGFPPTLKVLNYFVACVFFFHLVENHTHHSNARRPTRRSWDEEREALRQRIASGDFSDADAPAPGPSAPTAPPPEEAPETTSGS